MTTLILNRSLLRLKRVELLDYQNNHPSTETPSYSSPFGLRPRLQADALLEHPDFEMDQLDTMQSLVPVPKRREFLHTLLKLHILHVNPSAWYTVKW